jgi:hypothetical protein
VAHRQGLNIEKVSRTAKGPRFAVKAYFRQSCGEHHFNRAAARSLFEDVPAPIFGKVPRKAVVKTPVRAGCNRMWQRMTATLV